MVLLPIRASKDIIDMTEIISSGDKPCLPVGLVKGRVRECRF